MRSQVAKVRAVLGAVLLTGFWYGCAGDVPDVAGPPELSVVQQQGLEQAMRAQERHTTALMARGDVVGTAVGLGAAGAPVVMVYLERGRGAGIPAEVDGFRVLVSVTGPIRALAQGAPGVGSLARKCPTPPCGGGEKDDEGSVDRTARFDRPVPIGVSTGHPDITAGTIGARVTDGTDVFALSNNHVYADENKASVGDNVLQPGTYDGGVDPADGIGRLDDYEPIAFGGTANVMDAAIALSGTDQLGNATPSDGFGAPSSATTTAVPGMRVMKYGRTTGLTKGRVEAVNAMVNVQYESGLALFEKQVIVRGGGFSAPGDSGSLIVVEKGSHALKAVALLFAGSSSVTVGNPIDEILARFGVTIDGN